MGDIAYIFAPENCDFCKTEGKEVEAKYDGKTVHGPWAYMCEEHFEAMGVGLGTGRGQRLIVGERPKDQPYTEDGDIDDEIANKGREEKLGVQESETPPSPPESVNPEPSKSETDTELEEEKATEKVSNGTPHINKMDWGDLSR
jgi:hypothetical protein